MSADIVSVLGRQVLLGALQEILGLLIRLGESGELSLIKRAPGPFASLVLPVKLDELGYLIKRGHASSP